MAVKLGGAKDYSAMQGPCPSGFHVPTNDEWVTLCGILTSTFGLASTGATMQTYLKMPFAGYRNYSSSNVGTQGTYGLYWSSSAYSADAAYDLYFSSSALRPQNSYYRTHGFSVRCFKDTPTIPTTSWTTLYQGTGDAGVFWNSTDGLISVSGDGTTWYTIQDKNLGATTVYSDGATLSEANCGKYYQRGNNYGFPRTGTVTTSSTKVDARGYGPGNYYNSSTFITVNASPYNWSSVQNDNLRGGETGIRPGDLYKAYIGEKPTWKPNEHTVAYRPLTETTTMYDKSGNNYNLTKTDGSFTTIGGVSCFYNGGSSTGYFTLNSAPKIPSGNADRTILLWARPSSYSSSYSRYFLDYGGGSAGTAVYLTINTGQKYYASAYSTGITGNTMPTNAWSLMTFVSSGNTFYLYANGELQGSNSDTTINTTAVSSSWPLRLMRQNTSASSNYQVRGYLSEVIIEDKAWTATEIANYFNDNKAKYGL